MSTPDIATDDSTQPVVSTSDVGISVVFARAGHLVLVPGGVVWFLSGNDDRDGIPVVVDEGAQTV